MRLIAAAIALTLAAPAVAHWDGPADQARLFDARREVLAVRRGRKC